MAHAGLSHALFTSNPYLLGLSTSDRAGCAVRCARTRSRISGVVSVAVAASERNAAGSILGAEGSGKAP